MTPDQHDDVAVIGDRLVLAVMLAIALAYILGAIGP